VNDVNATTTQQSAESFTDVLPVTYIVSHASPNHQPLAVLLDSDSSITWITRQAIPHDMPVAETTAKIGNTLAGTFSSKHTVSMQHIKFIELQPTQSFEVPEFYIIDSACRYDMIMGRDCLQQANITLSFEKKVISDGKAILTMHTPAELQYLYDAPDVTTFVDYMIYDDDDETKSTNIYTTQLKGSNCHSVNVADIVNNQCKHLQRDQRNDLIAVLRCYPGLFSGKLRKYPEQVHFDIDRSVPPSFQWY
jgi:Retroviral aspartyl protease